MFGKKSVIGGGSGAGGDPPGLDMAMTVMAVVAVIGGAEQLGLWPAALDGAAGTIVPAAVVLVLAGRRVAGRVWLVLAAVWARQGRGRHEVVDGTGQDADHGGERVGDVEANATILAVHLPDPTLFPTAPANDDEKHRPSAM